MTRPTFRLLILLLCLTAAVLAHAGPSTLAYQGRLADAGGLPITATIGITFRLYDAPSGGTALWSEVQPAVDVDGGNLAVELGRVTPLPDGIWGRQLYLGVQIAGDSEMLPRPALTAAPFALRAAGTMRRTVVISAEGTPTENGAALLAAVARITDASAASPVAVELDAGTFDLGTQTLVMPSHTVLAGQGQAATLITSAAIATDSADAVRLSSYTTARDLTVRSTGIPTDSVDSVVALAAHDPAQFQIPIPGIQLERVTGESIGPNGSIGQRAGIFLCAYNSSARDITGRALGGGFTMGLRAACPSTNLVIDGAVLESGDAVEGVRGAYLAAGRGNAWRRMRVLLGVSATVQTVYGLRFFNPGGFSTSGPEGILSDSTIQVLGDPGVATAAIRVEGITIEDGGQLAQIERTRVKLGGVRGSGIVGLRLRDRSSNTPALASLRLHDVDVELVALGAGSDTIGVRAEGFPPVMIRNRIQVDCLAGSGSQCVGVKQPEGWVAPSGAQPLQLEHSNVVAAHAAPDGTGSSSALFLAGPARITDSLVRVQQSASNEPATTIRLSGNTVDMRVANSTLVSGNPADGNSGCLWDGVGGNIGELFGSHVQGIRCDGGQVGVACAGNTKRGTGLLTNTCP